MIEPASCKINMHVFAQKLNSSSCLQVYNITPYMKFHPGGVPQLKRAAGIDCTTLFMKYHAWVNADALLEKCLIGLVEKKAAQ